MPGPNTRNHDALVDMSVGEFVALQGALVATFERVEVSVGHIHFPANNGLLESAQAGQVRRLVDGWQQHLVQARKEAPDAHSPPVLDAPLNWSSLYLNSTLNVVKLPYIRVMYCCKLTLSSSDNLSWALICCSMTRKRSRTITIL